MRTTCCYASLFVGMVLVLASGCATTTHQEGPPATLKCRFPAPVEGQQVLTVVSLSKVDEKPWVHFRQRGDIVDLMAVNVPAGPHTLEVIAFAQGPNMSKDKMNDRIMSSAKKPFHIILNAIAGHVYEICASASDESTVSLWIEDTGTGVVVAGHRP
jgi:hypothetical protein